MRRVVCAVLCAAAFMAVPVPALAAGNGQLVAVATASGGGLVTLNPDGTGLRTLWAPGSGHALSAPSWAPDGNSIVFADAGKIMLYDLAGGQVRALTAGPGDGAPTWSPDGASIAFARAGVVLEVRRDGSDVQPLLEPDDPAPIDGLAWAPDDSVMAIVSGGALALVSLDGSDDVEIVEDAGVTGMPAWTRDAAKLAYTAPKEGSPGTEIKYLPAWLSGGWVLGGSYTEPGWAPDGLHVVFGGDFIRWWEPGDPNTLRDAAPGSLAEPDWQPCVAGVTVSCVSVTPPPPPFRCPDATASAVAGHAIWLPNLCPGADSLEILERPPHGTAGTSLVGLGYRPYSTFSGTEVIRFRGRRFNRGSVELTPIATLTIAVAPAPAAPKLTVLATPRLDRHGRALLHARCDRACTVSLRLRSRLHTGKVVQGRLVKRLSAAGAPFSLRLARGTIPARRRVVGVRIVGTLTGADGLKRNFTLTLR